MHKEARKRHIIKFLGLNDQVYTPDIARQMHVSEITVRRDLIEMEKKGLLFRTHGGAIKTGYSQSLFSFDHRLNINAAEKEYICRLASGFIEEEDIIFIDCGTTLFRLCKFIKTFKKLTVITNSLPVVSELMSSEHIKTHLIGGEIINDRRAIYGLRAENNIREYHANKAFVGSDGISLRKGLSSYDEKEAAITLKMMQSTDTTYLLCDSSKVEKDSFMAFAPLNLLDFIITDKGIDERIIKEYEKRNIKVIS